MVSERAKALDQISLVRDLLRCRLLITTAAVDKLGLHDLASIMANRQLFLATCNAVFKKAQAILIRDILALEQQIARLEEQDQNCKGKRGELNHWIRILESFYDSFLWIASGNDRSNVSKIYKGPKCGKLSDQNIDSVLKLAWKYNEDSYSFAIPLDFSRFSCVCDLMLLDSSAGGNGTSFIEVKEGKVNAAFLEAREMKSAEAYLGFFDRYGDKGIKQGERCFRQEKVLADKTSSFGSAPGIYTGGSEVRLLVQPKTEYENFTGDVETLLRKARRGEYAVQAFDDCLSIAAVDTSSPKRASLADFDARLFVLGAFIDEDAANRPEAEGFVRELQKVRFTDWLEGLGSIFLVPPPLRPLHARSLLDLVFGRIRLLAYFDAPNFVALGRAHGLQIGFIRRRQTERLASVGLLDRDEIFGGRALGYFAGSTSIVMGSAKIHEMIFNWVRPMSIIQELREMESLLNDIGGHPHCATGKPLFSEKDLESA